MEGAATKAMLDASGRSGNAADGPARVSAAAVALRPAAENFQQDRGPCPGNLSAAVREANACGRKLDATHASIFQQPANHNSSNNSTPNDRPRSSSNPVEKLNPVPGDRGDPSHPSQKLHA